MEEKNQIVIQKLIKKKEPIKIPDHIKKQYKNTEEKINKVLTRENLSKLAEAFEFINLEIEKNKISGFITISSSIAGAHNHDKI